MKISENDSIVSFFASNNINKKNLTAVGFEPTPTFVDYDLNVAP